MDERWGETSDFYLMLNLLYFASLVKNLPVLRNERINRLQYSFGKIYPELGGINFSRLKMDAPHQELYSDITNSCFEGLGISDEITFKKKLTAMLIISILYKEILRFYSKKIFWQKSIESKISDIIMPCIVDLCGLLQKTRDFKNIHEYYSFIDSTLNSNFSVKHVRERQKLKHYNNYFNEFTELNSITYISSRKEVATLTMSLNNKNQLDSKIVRCFLEDADYILATRDPQPIHPQCRDKLRNS
jgi:hypothetical protein